MSERNDATDPAVTGLRAVAPSTVDVGESFALNVKVLTDPYVVDWAAGWRHQYPAPRGPFNRSPRPGFHFMDNVPPAWDGTIEIVGDDGYDGPDGIDFADGAGPATPNDRRPIRRIPGLRFTSPGTKVLHLTDPATGATAVSNPIEVGRPAGGPRLFWGDLHAHTVFTDGLRCPEEVCGFARDEGFLDIFALTDHMEALTDTQWRYFTDVVNHHHEPGRFATLVGQEWTNHVPELGAPGHRNLYFPGDGAPAVRCLDPRYETLETLYAFARDHGAIVVPHHSANVVMGAKWEMGHDPEVERLVEIHSIWGNSERPASAGNPLPIELTRGETEGRHVFDALAMGRRYGILGSGDIHDGRPGDELHRFLGGPEHHKAKRQGIVGVWADELSREAVFDALWNRRVYATTNHRTILRFQVAGAPMGSAVAAAAELPVRIEVASEVPVAHLELVKNGEDVLTREPGAGEVTVEHVEANAAAGSWYMVRVTREDGGMAWSSPVWVE